MAAKAQKKNKKAAKPAPKVKAKATLKASSQKAAKSKKIPLKKAPLKKAITKETLKAKASNKKAEEVAAVVIEEQEDEFDPQAFFEASGGKGIFRAHIMRKERVDFNLHVRYRYLDGPLVYNAELLNLSKGGLALRTPKSVKLKTIVRVEIPLPHTSELFSIQAECIWSEETKDAANTDKAFLTGFRFMQMSLAKQTVINNFIQQRRDEVVMAKIGLDKFKDSAPVVGID